MEDIRKSQRQAFRKCESRSQKEHYIPNSRDNPCEQFREHGWHWHNSVLQAKNLRQGMLMP